MKSHIIIIYYKIVLLVYKGKNNSGYSISFVQAHNVRSMNQKVQGTRGVTNHNSELYNMHRNKMTTLF